MLVFCPISQGKWIRGIAECLESNNSTRWVITIKIKWAISNYGIVVICYPANASIISLLCFLYTHNTSQRVRNVIFGLHFLKFVFYSVCVRRNYKRKPIYTLGGCICP